MINIIGNALKFTESGFVITSITVENREEDDIELKFTIKDTGIGISKERLEFLFQPFQQEDSSTTRKYGGTGLGLTISKKIIEMMGGKIWADSEKNSGSTFYFTIKCKIGKNNRKIVNNVSVLKGLNIILMEDNPGESEVYNGMLEGFIENIFQIKSIEEMEKIIEERAENNEKPIDIIIADSKSGEERIFDSIDRIKYLYKGYDEIEIILLKSLDDKNLIERIKRDSFVKIIKKPVKVSEIHDAILSAKVLRNLKSVEKKDDYVKEINYTKTLVNKKILIAEDQEVNRVVIKGILEESGAEMDFAVNGLEVLKFLKKSRYDLIMLDIQMPEMDGFDTIKAIREKEEYKDLPVIAITAHAMKSEIEKCLLMGINDHVSKPIDNDDLF